MKVKYKEQEIDIPENATIEVINGDLVVTPKEFGFKDGDFIVSGWKNKVSECEWISILKGYFSKGYYNQYASLILSGNNRGELEYIGHCDAQEYTRLATGSEKQLFIEKLKERGKRWNPKTKQIEDILKVGDICIFWDDDKSKAVIGVYSELDNYSACPSGFEFVSNIKEEGNNLCFKNSIKCDSLEQYKSFLKQ